LFKGKINQSDNTFQVADRSLSRVINQKAIIDKIYQCDGVSRAQLAKELGISKPAITRNVENLIEIGLVEEKGEGKSAEKGGRKPVMLYFNKDHRYVGALDLAYTQPVCAVFDLKGHIVGLKKTGDLKAVSEDMRRERIKNTFLEILEEHQIILSKLDTIVISQPGIIEYDRNKHYSEKRHHVWTEIGLDHYLKEELGAHVSVRNDVNLAAIGEMHFDCDQKLENLIYVSCGVGLGAGIILNGTLYNGDNNAAGEIGSLIMENGQSYEECVAMDSLIKKIEQKYEENGEPKKISFSEIVSLSKRGDKVVNEVIYETGRLLGHVIYNCCVVLGITTVKFGGEYLELGDKLFEGIESVLKTRTVSKPEIMPGGLRQIAGLFGCFVVGKDKIIERFTRV